MERVLIAAETTWIDLQKSQLATSRVADSASIQQFEDILNAVRPLGDYENGMYAMMRHLVSRYVVLPDPYLVLLADGASITSALKLDELIKIYWRSGKFSVEAAGAPREKPAPRTSRGEARQRSPRRDMPKPARDARPRGKPSKFAGQTAKRDGPSKYDAKKLSRADRSPTPRSQPTEYTVRSDGYARAAARPPSAQAAIAPLSSAKAAELVVKVVGASGQPPADKQQPREKLWDGVDWTD